MMIANLVLAHILQTPSTPAPAQFFTVETLFTAAGATTAVFTVTSVVHGLWQKVSPRWFAACFSLFLTIVGIGVNHQPYGASTILLAIINAAVVYAAAVGANNIASPRQPVDGTAPPGAPTAPQWRQRWWP